MRKITVIFFVAMSAYALTLEEKIEMARRAADASVEGKIENVDIINGKLPSSSEAKSELLKVGVQKLLDNPKSEQRYVVDTSKDFIGGRFIGRVGQSEADKKDMIASIKKAEAFSAKAKAISFAETDLFFIAAEDSEALSQVKKIAKSCENVFEQLFPKGSYVATFVPKNSIRVFPKDTKMADVVVSKSDDMVFVDIKWSEHLELDVVCSALVDSVLKRLFASKERVYKLPQWLHWGIECVVADEVKLGVSTFFARVASENPYSDINSILGYSKQSVDENIGKAHSFWLLKALQKLTDKQSMFALIGNIISMNLTPTQTFAEFEKMLSLPQNVDVQLWLGCVISSEVCARSGGVDSCRDSEIEVLRLCSIRVFVDGKPESVPCDRLFAFGESAKISAKTRLLEIKMLLAKVNPVFFNATVVLGEVYEAFIAENQKLYAKKMSEFIDEFTKARATVIEIEKIMNKNFGKMSVK